MTIKELGLMLKQHEITSLGILDIVEKYIKNIPKEMIHDLEEYNTSIVYPIESCMNGQSI